MSLNIKKLAKTPQFFLLLFLLFALIGASIFVGTAHFNEFVIVHLRLPRIVMSVFAGASLALCGAIFQSIFRNPICDPYILGISSGASIGAALAFILGLDFYLFGVTTFAINYRISNPTVDAGNCAVFKHKIHLYHAVGGHFAQLSHGFRAYITHRFEPSRDAKNTLLDDGQFCNRLLPRFVLFYPPIYHLHVFHFFIFERFEYHAIGRHTSAIARRGHTKNYLHYVAHFLDTNSGNGFYLWGNWIYRVNHSASYQTYLGQQYPTFICIFHTFGGRFYACCRQFGANFGNPLRVAGRQHHRTHWRTVLYLHFSTKITWGEDR